jgi:uncharacterized membrane protein YfcA
MTLLALIAFVAAVVNGALGYGFSAVAVPLALLFVSNRELNPAIVVVEIAMNAWVLWHDRAQLPTVWRRVALVALALPIGIVVGTAVLVHTDPTWLRFATYIALLPLILLQAAGLRRAIRAEKTAGAALGAGVGLLYAVSTIAGPPLALFLNNQGFTKGAFRAALGLVKLVAASLTLAAYAHSSLLTGPGLRLLPVLLPAIAIGLPLGRHLIRHVDPEAFRRLCMCFDAAIVAFGISALLRSLELVTGPAAYLPFALVVLYDLVIFARFRQRAAGSAVPSLTQATP